MPRKPWVGFPVTREKERGVTISRWLAGSIMPPCPLLPSRLRLEASELEWSPGACLLSGPVPVGFSPNSYLQALGCLAVPEAFSLALPADLLINGPKVEVIHVHFNPSDPAPLSVSLCSITLSTRAVYWPRDKLACVAETTFRAWPFPAVSLVRGRSAGIHAQVCLLEHQVLAGWWQKKDKGHSCTGFESFLPGLMDSVVTLLSVALRCFRRTVGAEGGKPETG